MGRRISDLPDHSLLGRDDFFPVVDILEGRTKKVTSWVMFGSPVSHLNSAEDIFFTFREGIHPGGLPPGTGAVPTVGGSGGDNFPYFHLTRDMSPGPTDFNHFYAFRVPLAPSFTSFYFLFGLLWRRTDGNSITLTLQDNRQNGLFTFVFTDGSDKSFMFIPIETELTGVQPGQLLTVILNFSFGLGTFIDFGGLLVRRKRTVGIPSGSVLPLV